MAKQLNTRVERTTRRTAIVGYARGEETRARILREAIKLFGEKGFDAVSTREIAGAAGVPAPSLQDYFESKEGLYIACMDYIQAACLEAIDPALTLAEEAVRGETNADRLIEHYCDLLEAMTGFMLDGEEVGRALFAVRHDLPSKGGVWQFRPVMTTGLRLETCFAALVRRISGDTLPLDLGHIIAMTISGQLVMLSVQRLRLEGLANWPITAERLAMLKKIVRQHAVAILRSHQSA